jgi:hypothetical protein
MCGGGLVPRYDKPDIKDFAESLKRFDYHHVSTVRNPVDKPHAFRVKASDKKLTAGYFSHTILLWKRKSHRCIVEP